MRLPFALATIEVLQPVLRPQCRTGRAGSRYWDVGVPPSGPMDTLAFRLANRLVGNSEDSAALELTVTGPDAQVRTAKR